MSNKHRTLMFGVACALEPARADNLADCMQQIDMPRAIAGCSSVIESAATSTDHRLIAFRNRSAAYAATGDFERADQDYLLTNALYPDRLWPQKEAVDTSPSRANLGTRSPEYETGANRSLC
jgi:hypothetical protein